MPRTYKQRLQPVWSDMKQRCYNKNCHAYSKYGGRGITVCPEWKDNFQAFFDWALISGYKPELYLDREDNNKGYFPENCRWVTPKHSVNNRTTTRMLTIDGETKCISDWLTDVRCSVDNNRIYRRLERGWTPKDAVFKPLQPYNKQ